MKRIASVASCIAAFGCNGPGDVGDAQAPDANGNDALADVADASTDVATTDAVLPDASGCPHAGQGASMCNTLPSSQVVPVTCTTPPPALGGTIVDGYYLLTAASWDTSSFDGGACPQSETHKSTIEVCGNVFEWLEQDTVNSTYRGSQTFSTNGTALTFTEFCPSLHGPTDIFPYTATPTTLTIHLTYPNGVVLVLTSTKQ